jgi:hypothetical protein
MSPYTKTAVLYCAIGIIVGALFAYFVVPMWVKPKPPPLLGYVPHVTIKQITYVADGTFTATVNATKQPDETGGGVLVVEVVDRSTGAHADWVESAISLKLSAANLPDTPVTFHMTGTRPDEKATYDIVATVYANSGYYNQKDTALVDVVIP